MKQILKIMSAACVLPLCMLFLSCEDLLNILFEEVNGQSYDVVTATKSVSWDYSSSSDAYRADDSVLNINVSGSIGGKTLYLVKANPNDYSISLNDTRIVKSTASGFRAASEEETVTDVSDLISIPAESGKRHFTPPPVELPETAARNASADIFSGSSTVSKISRTVGTTKNIYVDDDTEISKFTQKTATLQAVGTYCNVWIVNDYYSIGSSSGNRVNKSVAQSFASKFDDMYKIITNIYGDESDKLIDADSSTRSTIYTKNMDDYSDTGTYVNIVIYDIGNDYSKRESEQCCVLGYFYAKDYYYSTKSSSDIIGKSNKGKYFYIDSAYAVNDLDDTISTLAHEFQHMINFNQKNIKHNLAPDTNYNEMLSMLCEDMMQSHLGVADKNSPKSRFQTFNSYYYLSGIREYRDGNYVSASYANAYAFGAWLARNYGGAALIKEISTNSYIDNESIVRAVRTVSGNNYTFDDLFAQFLTALLDNSSAYTMKKDAAQTVSYDGYTYPMTSINLLSSAYSPESEYMSENRKYAGNGYQSKGPFVFSNNYGTSLRSEYGISIHEIKTYSSGTTRDTISLSSSGAEGLVNYFIIK